MTTTRRQFFARASALGIEIDEDRDPNGVLFMAHAPAGFKFEASTCHCCNLGGADRGETVDYDRMTRELELVPCTDEDCEYCND
jgi:hypothetical protein